MISVSGRERRFVLGGLVVLIPILALKGFPWWQDWLGSARSSAMHVLEEAARAEQSVGALDETIAALESARQQFLDLAPAFVGHGSHAVSGATLASAVAGIAALSGLELGALHVRHDSTTTGGVYTLAVRGEAGGGIREVMEFLAAVEAQPAWLAVRELAIGTPDPAAARSRPETLRVQFLIEGLALNPEVPDP